MRRHRTRRKYNTNTVNLMSNMAKKTCTSTLQNKIQYNFNKSSVAYHIEPLHRVTIRFKQKKIWRLTKRFKFESQLRRKVYARFKL